MDRNTILAIVLSVALFIIVLNFFPTAPPPKKQDTPNKVVRKKKDPVKDKKKTQDGSLKKDATNPKKNLKSNPETQKTTPSHYDGLRIVPAEGYDDKSTGFSKKSFSVQTKVFDIRFTPVDGAITSLKLREYKYKNKIRDIPSEIEIVHFENDILKGIPDEKDKEKILNYYSKDNNTKVYTLKKDLTDLTKKERKTISNILNSAKLMIDAVFSPNNKEISPLATSFRGAKGLKDKVKSVYRYSVYNYKKGRLKKQGDGNLEEGEDYNELIEANIEKLSKRYATKMSNLVIILFKSQYTVQKKSGDKTFEFIKIYTLRNHPKDYLIDLDMTIKNLSDSEYAVVSNSNENASFYIHWGKSLGPYYDSKHKTTYDEQFKTGYLKLDGEEELVDESREDISQFKWLELDSRYLAVYLITEWNSDSHKTKRWKKTNYFGEIRRSKQPNEEIISLGFKQFILKPEKDQSFHVSVFVGPKTRSILQQAHYEDFNLELVRDRGWFPYIKVIEWPIEWSLFALNDYVHNYGLAIIILTIFLKILMHPLTKKSLDSTRKMQELAPKMKELEAKYKKDPQQKQKAIMKMYKKEGVNPLGGCLPILLQLPVFWALYAVFPVLLDLKNADFLWINDLSSPDTIMNIDLGLTNSLNILPIIMTITSVFQMKFTPQPTMGASGDKAQAAKMMQYMMPAVFLFIFWTMPSGLVLYWTVQNILQIGQQLYVNKFGKKKSKNTDKGGTK